MNRKLETAAAAAAVAAAVAAEWVCMYKYEYYNLE
jgi:hypothetical protein